MQKHDRQINRLLMIGWLIIVLTLMIAYLGEYLKGMRTGSYMLLFSLVTVLTALACLLLYYRDKSSRYLRYFVLAGYNIMNFFMLLTGSTTMVFTYTMP